MFATGAAGITGTSTETTGSLAATGTGLADGVADAAVAFRGSVVSLDVSAMSDDQLLDLVPVLERVRRVVEATLGSSLGELDVRGTTDERFGHRTGQWFAMTMNCSVGEAKKRVQVGRRLRRLEFVSGAFTDGSISFEHARVVSDLATPRNTRIVDDLQVDLVGLAVVLPFERWRAEAKGLVDLADGDGSFRPGPENSTLRMTTGFGGSVELAGTLTALDGAALREAVEAEADRLRLRYRDEQRTGITDTVPTRAELLAEALASLVRQGLVAARGSKDGRGPVTELTLIANAADPLGNDDLPESTVRTLCCDPVIRAVVLDSLGNPVDLGRTTRIVPKGLRRALEVRDGGCTFPGCDAPSSWCDLHHVVHWADGGPTSAENLASLCRHHHGVTHRRGWEMTADPHMQHRFTWTRPDGNVLRSQRASDLDDELNRAGPLLN
jgi:hypothetical protein